MKAEVKTRIGIILVGLVVGAISYWFQPYNKETVLGINMWLLLFIGAFIASILLMVFAHEKPSKIVSSIALGVALAVLVRIIYDTTFWDPTSHNLAPFEFIFALIVTVPGAFLGAFLVILVKTTLAAVKK